MIYLDNNATTFIDPCVKKIILRELELPSGNPSSIHSFGQSAKAKLIQSRQLIARFLGVRTHEIIFTSSATEAVNLFMNGIESGHVITTVAEHPCVFEKMKELKKSGVDVTFLPVNLSGAVSVEDVKKAIQPNTCLIAVMAVNNETGVKTDIEAIAEIAEDKKIFLFVDAVAQFGKEKIKVPRGVTGMCFTGHKCHGPQGVAALFVRSRYPLKPLILGGVQEYQKRGGTENVLGIVAFAEAVRILDLELDCATQRMQDLRDRLEIGLLDIGDVAVNGTGSKIANTLNIAFKGVDGESLLAHLDLQGIAASHGSACSAGALEPSRVLLEMGIPKEAASSSIRFSLSRFTTLAEIDATIEIVSQLVSRLRDFTSNRHTLNFKK